jgi:hypothetical protein
MIGWRLFLDKLRQKPAAALGQLALDYATFIGMVLFFIFLWSTRAPLRLLGERRRLRVCQAFVDAVARLAHGS